MGKLNKTNFQLQLKKGLDANINATATKNLAIEGEPHWTTDTNQLYVFDGTQNLRVPTADLNGYVAFEQSHGELYTHENSVTVSVVSAGTYYTITGLTAGVSSGTGYDVINATNGTHTIGDSGAGLYKVNVHISATANKVCNLEFALHKSGTKENKISIKRKINTAADEGAVALTGLIDLVSTDVVDIRVTSDSASTTVGINHMNFNLARVTR